MYGSPVDDQRDRAAQLVPEEAHSAASTLRRGLLDVHELAVGQPVDDPGLRAVADRARAGLRQRRDRLPGLDVDGLGGVAPAGRGW